MLRENRERWLELCEQASKEQDPEKLRELIREINRLLDAKYERLRGDDSATKS
ncbi:MAG: hypothetical protein WBX12_02810 [Candidatus Acidiferrales bacterium]